MRTIKAFTILFLITGAALMAKPVLAKDSPYSNFNFIVIIDGARLGGFSEVFGLATETEVVEYREGGDPTQTAGKIPGLHKVSDITLKRGIIAGNTDLWDWRQMVIDGDIEGARKNGTIIMYDNNNEPVATWTFENGWPAKIRGPSQKSDGNEVAFEELTIAHENLVRIK